MGACGRRSILSCSISKLPGSNDLPKQVSQGPKEDGTPDAPKIWGVQAFLLRPAGTASHSAEEVFPQPGRIDGLLWLHPDFILTNQIAHAIFVPIGNSIQPDIFPELFGSSSAFVPIGKHARQRIRSTVRRKNVDR